MQPKRNPTYQKWLSERIDASFVSIYSANLSIIHGATIYTAVYQAFTLAIYHHPSADQTEYYSYFYTSTFQLVCGLLLVLSIIVWVAVEYYCIMIIVRQQPSAIDTVVQYTIGASEIASAFVVNVPLFLLWSTTLTAGLSVLGYSLALRDLKISQTPTEIINEMRDHLRLNRKILGTLLFFASVNCVTLTWPAVVLPKTLRMNVSMGVMTAITLGAVCWVAARTNKMVKNAWVRSG